MISAETAILLAVAAAFDARTIGDGDVTAWHAALYDADFATAREAVIRHYRSSDDRITPAQIRYLMNPDTANKAVPRPPDNIAENPHEWRKRVSRSAVQGPLDNQRRRDLVLAYPDIAKRLCEPPASFAQPEAWNGFVPAADYEGPHGPAPNTSPIRAQLLAILTEAADRADQDTRPAPAP